MVAHSTYRSPQRLPTPSAVVALLKPITWFPPMWAYCCGAISAGTVIDHRWPYVLAGMILAGPLVCGTSQAVNDWFDRHVDAINEPDRVIPSGRMPGRWGLYVAIAGTVLSLLFAFVLGPVVFVAATIGLVLAWAYSMPPLRLKEDGWAGNAAVGLSYETLPWITAAAAALGTLPANDTMVAALLYGIGAHGILTLNDFKAIEGDRRMGIASLPVKLGVQNAARLAAAVMGGAQLGVILLLLWRGNDVHAAAVLLLLAIQGFCMVRLIRDPVRYAVWYSAIGVGLYVTGMMVSAFALRSQPVIQI